MATNFVTVTKLLGIDFKVKEEMANNIMFRFELGGVEDSLEAVKQDIADKIHLKEIAEYIPQLKSDFQRGVANGDFEPGCVTLLLEKCDTMLAEVTA